LTLALENTPEIADPRNGATVGQMQFLKRIELWILLIALVAGLFFVFKSKPQDDSGSTDTTSASATDDAPLKIHRCVLTRDYANAQLDLEVRVRNDVPAQILQETITFLATAN